MRTTDTVCGRHADNASASCQFLLMYTPMHTYAIPMFYASTFDSKIRKPNREL